MDYTYFTELMSRHYSFFMVKQIRRNRSVPSYKKMLLFKRAYDIPFEFWENVRANLTNLPKRGRKMKQDIKE